MINTLKRAAELLSDSAESLFECNTVDGKWESCAAKDDWEELLLVVDDLERMAQVEPVAGQCKFDGDSEWAMCSYHHHVTVQANKVGWPGYNTRPLYAAPQEPVNQQLLTALRKFDSVMAGCADFPDTSSSIIRLCAAVTDARSAIASAEAAQKGGA